jgi:anthranilate phosphoribosyltransferase
VFAKRGVDAWVFRGDDGLDELTTTTTSRIWEVSGGSVTEHVLDPLDLGIPRGTAEGLRGQDAAFNADVVRRVVAGEPGQVRDAVVLNAGAALAIHAAAPGTLQERLADGIARAQEAIDSGRAKAALETWVEVSARG